MLFLYQLRPGCGGARWQSSSGLSGMTIREKNLVVEAPPRSSRFGGPMMIMTWKMKKNKLDLMVLELWKVSLVSRGSSRCSETLVGCFQLLLCQRYLEKVQIPLSWHCLLFL